MHKNVLVAIDLTEKTAHLALEGARTFVGKETPLSVLHVVESQYVQYSFDPTFTGSMARSLETQAISSAENRVAELCAPYEIGADSQHVILGHTSTEIHKFAEEHGCDLIVMGSHGWRGWQRLLGSTANAVLHGTPVDVFICHIPPD